jgi:hypothetical protein
MKQLVLLAAAALLAAPAYAGPYDAVRIVAPGQDATVHDNRGNVAVVVSASPPLDVAAGDRIVLLMDGRTVAKGPEAHFVLTEVDRGVHTVQAQVTSADGRILAASPPVTFDMWRASRLFPARKG